MNPNQVSEPKSAQELVQRPSFRRHVARVEELGESVSITTREGKTIIAISCEVVPTDVAQAFAKKFQELDTRGFLLVEVAPSKGKK